MKTNKYGETHYRIDVISMNNDGTYDLQNSTESETLQEAKSCYDGKKIGTKTDKILVDVWANKIIEASNKSLIA